LRVKKNPFKILTFDGMEENNIPPIHTQKSSPSEYHEIDEDETMMAEKVT
jgi:hypothetical protein